MFFYPDSLSLSVQKYNFYVQVEHQEVGEEAVEFQKTGLEYYYCCYAH